MTGIVPLISSDVFGFVRPYNDAHTLGVSTLAKMLKDAGYKVVIGDKEIATAVNRISSAMNISFLIKWIKNNNITHLGFSYRLEPKDAQLNFGKLYYMLSDNKQFIKDGGNIKQLYFAGLPDACKMIAEEYQGQIPVFSGDETPAETLLRIGVPKNKIPPNLISDSKYDDKRMDFANEIIYNGEYNYFLPPKRKSYSNCGTRKDSLNERLRNNLFQNNLPLSRVHVGPYSPDHDEAVKLFKDWLGKLSQAGYLDIVSVGTSQLSQSNFGENWENKANGGGVPVNSKKDLDEIWQAARPMLVRTYSATKNIPAMAKVFEDSLNMAWHALSLWWFNELDGRGPYSLEVSLKQHFATIDYIAKINKPFEPNIPHHFSFRGGDDYTYVLSAYLAAIAAKRAGVRTIVVQTMLNTPKSTWGVQDLAKSRSLIRLIRELGDEKFKVYLQPRAGLDYFSSDLTKAKTQLAAVTAMMDDIEPENVNSPEIIHVVSYCEAVKLADPAFINESLQISYYALSEYRRYKKLGYFNDLINEKELTERVNDLYVKVKSITRLLEKTIPDLYSAKGFFEIFKLGIMPVPYLWEGREEFENAVNWDTALVNGGVCVVDKNDKKIDAVERVAKLIEVYNYR